MLLATQGYVMSFYTSAGIHACINELMHKAIANSTDMFNQPEQVYSLPFQVWELQASWDMFEETYRLHTPISKRPVALEVKWAAQQSATSSGVSASDDKNSQQEDSLFFNIVECNLHSESLCFPSSSKQICL